MQKRHSLSSVIITVTFTNTVCYTMFQCSLLLHRMERNIIITANDTDEPPTVSPPSVPLHPNPTWPTPSGIDEDEARRIGESPILESPVYSLCQNYTAESLEFISESCMLDLLVWKTNVCLLNNCKECKRQSYLSVICGIFLSENHLPNLSYILVITGINVDETLLSNITYLLCRSVIICLLPGTLNFTDVLFFSHCVDCMSVFSVFFYFHCISFLPLWWIND